MKDLRSLITLPLVALVFAACASGGGGGGNMGGGEEEAAPSGDAVQITIINSAIPATSMRVRIREGSSNRLLGSLNPGQTRTFNYSPIDATREFVLVAEPADGRRTSTRPFTLQGMRSVRWDTNDPAAVTSR